MKAVLKHEIKSYFTSVSGYVFGAFVLLFAGIFTMVYNLKSAVTNFEYVPGSMPFVFLVVVPILTMRVLAEERRQKTDQLLYSLPLSMTQVVLGKYLAMLAIFAVPTAIMCVYPVVLSAFGAVHLPMSFCSIFGFFLLGASLISIGTFVSSVTESQAVAAGLCFVVMLINYYISSLAGYLSTSAFTSLAALTVVVVLLVLIIWLMTRSSTAALITGIALEAALIMCYALFTDKFEGLFASLMEQLSLFDRFDSFVYGVFNLKSVVYFVTVIGLFLFLSVQSMEKRRWSE